MSIYVASAIAILEQKFPSTASRCQTLVRLLQNSLLGCLLYQLNMVLIVTFFRLSFVTVTGNAVIHFIIGL
ncbi:hypothetical protein OnM2_091043 [Erysiphe neolycopersici]|uniref:Uncharacterized protein n=1 Tax=Erysiphe neolycopersici TaxID=212602 RepID=A0A420HCX7_9PEZI|nr:hypothetical protein OnM2_091043 [Erysiphe neolycopersici]